MTLPYDIARCATDDCPLADRCKRKTPGHPTYQAHDYFPGGIDCFGWIAIREKEQI